MDKYKGEASQRPLPVEKNPEVNTTLKVVENSLQESHDNDVDEETGFSFTSS